VLEKGTNPAPNYATFSFQNGGAPVSNIHVVDAIFKNGAAKDSTDMQPIGALGWHLSAEYFIDWTLALTVNDAEDKPLAKVSVKIADSGHSQIFTGITDSSGKVSAILNELHVFNTKSSVEKQRNTPYTVNIEKAGCSPAQFLQPPLAGPTLRVVQLSCH